MTRPRLALAIPTLGRAETLEHNLLAIVEEARALAIPIHVCDDAPDDEDTEARVRKVAARHPLVTYQRNVPTLGHDANLMKTIALPDADFVWLLADSIWIKPGQLTRIHDLLGEEDFVFLNAIVSAPEAARYVDAPSAEIVRDLFWNQSLTGATIYHRRVIDWAIAAGPDIKRNFPQLSVILDYCSNHDATVRWVPELTMTSLPKQSYWRARSVFQNWVDDWANVVNSYPRVFGPRDRARALSAHARGTGIFSPLNLIRYRGEGQFDRKATSREFFWDVVPVPRPLAMGLLLIPRRAAALAVTVKRSLRSLKQ